MANNKTKRSIAALCHVLTYALPFLLLRPTLAALAVIVIAHFIIDRWRLARFLVYSKNFLSPQWEDCQATGYPSERPAWLSVWLLIIADNLAHVLINGLALKYL